MVMMLGAPLRQNCCGFGDSCGSNCCARGGCVPPHALGEVSGVGGCHVIAGKAIGACGRETLPILVLAGVAGPDDPSSW